VQTTQVAQVAEVAEAPAQPGDPTIESKPDEAPAQAPFAGDAWAAALANTVAHKVADAAEPADVHEPAAELARPRPAVAAAEPVVAPSAPTAEPGWVDTSGSPWELEAKKASLLAATWDAPAPRPAEPASVAEAEKFLAEQPACAQISEVVRQSAGSAAEVAEAPAGQPEQVFAAETAEPTQMRSEEPAATEVAAESAYASGAQLDINATQEVPVLEPEASHYSGTLSAEPPADTAIENDAPAPVETPAIPPATQPPDMDALVARVLAKMNPEVLHKVTQEILKPVIEAIIKDELSQKK